jgi:bacillolysin
MKKLNFFLISALLIISFSASSQNFKVKTKKPAGQNSVNLNAVQMNGKAGLKSSSNMSFHISPALMIPDVKNKGIKFDKIIFNKNKPIYIEDSKAEQKSASIEFAEETFLNFIESVKTELHITNPDMSFDIKKTTADELGMLHINSVQKYRGIPIYGSESALHVSSGKKRFTGAIHRVNQYLNVQPALSSNEVISLVNSDLKNLTTVKLLSLTQRKILEYEGPECNLVVFESAEDTYNLVYEIIIRPNFLEQWKYYVDAHNGKIIRKYNNTFTDGPFTAKSTDLNGVLQTIDTYLENGKYFLINVAEDMFNAEKKEGMIVTLDANNTSTSNLNFSEIVSSDNTWNHPSGVSAHYNATVAYRYFKNTFNRKSINGEGGTILSLVNVAAEDGSSMENAFWNGKAAFYGNGGKDFKPLAGALDVAAHELGHGVVSNSANLEYFSQSGAINETYADIFGSMVDRADWDIGEDVTKDGLPLRNMQDPANGKKDVFDGWQPKHMSEIVTGAILDNFNNRDNEGVHINSGIGNYAFYLFATAVSKEKAEQAFYRALTVYLTKTSKFIDLRIAVVQAAKDLYGNDSNESAKAGEIFDAVGIYEEQQIDYNQDYPENPGQEYLICYNTNINDYNTLYRSSSAGTNFVALSTTEMKGKVSIMDNGSTALYVSGEDQLIGIDLNTGEEFVLSDEAFWENAAVSRDGLRVAGISTEIDTAIYVYDFNSGQWAKYMLYNPTTSHDNTNAGGVLFADAIEFDHTGEYLMYDAYNALNSTTADDIYYWDIGFIKVWDYQANDFGNGTISKLYETLPEGISIGNPVFAKNSPYIIAFDYYDEVNEQYGIFGANLNTGDVGLIYENLTIGYPSYSKKDDAIAFSGLDDQDYEVVGIVKLAANKIVAAGNASLLVEDAKWPVFYASGQRPLGLKPVCNFTADIKTGNSPLEIKFMDLSINNPTSWEWSFEGGNPLASNQQNPIVSFKSQGIYKVSLTAKNSFGSDTMTKTGYIQVSPATATDQLSMNFISFYPNPVDDVVHISSTENFSVSVFNLNGKKLIAENNKLDLDVSELIPGIYILEIHSGKDIMRKKLIKL